MSTQSPRLLETPPDWTEEEKPTLPGSPASIAHPTYKRFYIFLLALLLRLRAV